MYAFEGIGLILPVRDVTAYPERYNYVVYAVIWTCLIMFITFGIFTVSAWGDELRTPLITDNLPKTPLTYIMKVLFCFNLVFSYPLTLYPAHIIIENYLYAGWPKSKKRQLSKNISRTMLVLFTVVFTMWMGEKINKFLSILGSLSCTPIGFTFPALFHLKAVAETPKQKAVDWAIIIFSLVALVYCTTFSLIHWND